MGRSLTNVVYNLGLQVTGRAPLAAFWCRDWSFKFGCCSGRPGT
jgi:hypothetical protein